MIFLIANVVVCSAQITGRVVDEENLPIEFVNVVLLTRSDSSFVEGTITMEDGSFRLENSNKTSGILSISHVGYTTFTKNVPPFCDMGTIEMNSISFALDELEVKTTLPTTVIKNNAFVTNVENSILSFAGTANDVLMQVPMVMGQDGEFRIFGKGAPVIYVNNRKVINKDELSQINSADIKTVELITNPGAKYDASVNSIIRILTKRPQGEGWSGTLRSQNGYNPYFNSYENINLKYRTKGLEVFGNFNYNFNKNGEKKTIETHTSATKLVDQYMVMDNRFHRLSVSGKIGLSYLFNENHSIGAYYNNALSHRDYRGSFESKVLIDDLLTDELSSLDRDRDKYYPQHTANIYYNGKLKDLGIDFNADYLWTKDRITMVNDEDGTSSGKGITTSNSKNKNRLFAEKLVFSYPVYKGEIALGEEFTSTRFNNLYLTNAEEVSSTNTRVDENNMAGFVEIKQQFGIFNIMAGVRYEHVEFEYHEGEQLLTSQSKKYDNVFPTFSISATLESLQLLLSYTNKTKRPYYYQLKGDIDYINHYTLDGGNPYLKPQNLHTIDLTGTWGPLFAQISYSYVKNPIMNTTLPYDEDGVVTLNTYRNFSHINTLAAFIGGQFKLGIWQPKVNVGIQKQWLTIDYHNERKHLNSPIVLVQWQNAIHLPADIWLNIDMQWRSEGYEKNGHIDNSTSYLNAKLYKAFCHKRLGLTLEARDIFNKNIPNSTNYSNYVTIAQESMRNNRSVMLTIQYRFNTSRDRYKGTGAGMAEKNRL